MPCFDELSTRERLARHSGAADLFSEYWPEVLDARSAAFGGASLGRKLVHLGTRLGLLDVLCGFLEVLPARRGLGRAELLEHPPADVPAPAPQELRQRARRRSINHCTFSNTRPADLAIYNGERSFQSGLSKM